MAGDGPPEPRPEIRVLLADASRMNNQLLSSTMSRDRRFRVVEAVITREGLMRAMSLHHDVILVAADLEAPKGGLGATETVLESRPNAKVVVLVDELERETVIEVFRCGAKAAFGRNQPVASLLKCILCVHQGQVWGSSRELQFLLDALRQSRSSISRFPKNGLLPLSEREREVVRWVCEGLNNREIASRMQLSEHTVKNHLFRIFSRLGVSSRIEIMFSVLSQGGELSSKTAASAASDAERLEIYLKEAEHSALAKLAVAKMYLEGRGTEKDLVTGYMWLTRAQMAAREIMDECSAVAAAMDPREELKAQAQVVSWSLELQQNSLTKARSLSTVEQPNQHGRIESAASLKDSIVASKTSA